MEGGKYAVLSQDEAVAAAKALAGGATATAAPAS